MGECMKIALNGFGRIGKNFLRALLEESSGTSEKLEIVAINRGPGDKALLGHVFKYDTLLGTYPGVVHIEQDGEDTVLCVDNHRILVYAETNPENLPWKKLAIDWVVEASGKFTQRTGALLHIKAGAKKVLITAPSSDADVTIILGVNSSCYTNQTIVSLGSCTTNAVTPLLALIHKNFEIKNAYMTTVHSYTNNQILLDGAGSDLRRARAAALNMVPTSTGAAKATALAYPQLHGKFDGVSVRVPVASGSLVDVTFVAKRATSVEEINAALMKAAEADRWKPVFTVSSEPLVSSDILGLPYGAIADLSMTRVVDGTLVKVLAWYDNEMGYVHTLVEHVLEVAKRL